MFIDKNGLGGIFSKVVSSVKRAHAPVNSMIRKSASDTVKITRVVSKPAVKIYRKTAMPILKKAAPILSKIAPLLAFIPAVGWVVYLVYATYVAQAYNVVKALEARRDQRRAEQASDAELAELDKQIFDANAKIETLKKSPTSNDPYKLPEGAERDAAIAELTARKADGTLQSKKPLTVVSALGASLFFLL